MKDFLKNIKKENMYNIIIFFIVSTLYILNLFDLKYKLYDSSANYKRLYLVFMITTILYCIIVFIINKLTISEIKRNIPKMFIMASLSLGTLFLFASPMFTGSDEHNHYYRIYEITEGKLVTPTKNYVGSKLPKSLEDTFRASSGYNTKVKYAHIERMNKVKLNKEKTTQFGKNWFNMYSNTALYSPVSYTPHVIGFCIGKILNLKPLMIGMLGRLFNLLVYVLFGYLCLKIIPKAKMFYMLILLSPNMLQCATTLSADAFTNVIFLLILSLILNIYYRNEKVKTIEEIILFILCIIISLCKIVYLPVILALLIINKDKFIKGKKEKIIFIATTFIISSLLSILWIHSTNEVFLITYNQSVLQKKFILNNISEYIFVLIRTYSTNLVNYIECLFVGTTMYHSQLKMPAFISIIYVIIVLIALIKDKEKNKLLLPHKILIVFIGLTIICLISTAIYLQFTAQFFSVGNNIVTGLQGRYYIPVVFLIPFIYKPNKKKNNIDELLLYKISLAINLVTLFYMVNQFLI